MSTRYSLTRRYLRAHVWLHRQCDRLSPKWQKRIVFGLCIVYFACAAAMIAQLFLPEEKHEPAVPVSRLVDSPIKRDSLHRNLIQETPT